MQKKRRNGRNSTKTSVGDEIAHLRGLDLRGLRARWQGVFQRQAPAHLTRHLLFAIIAYRIQADRFGGLDHDTKQVLDRTFAEDIGPAMSARMASFDQKRIELSPGSYCRTLIGGYKCPRSFEFRSEPLPVTAVGKVRKNVLRDPYWVGHARKI
jgi:acyl-CoA synthetase (AMP-forming)/AMP-acid ligase II